MQWPSFLANNKISKIITLFFVIFMILEITFCVPFMLHQNELSRYSPFVAGSSIVFISYATLYAKRKPFCDMYNRVFPNLWPLKCAGPENFEYIRKFGILAKYLTLFLTLLILVCATLGLPWFGDEYDLYITIKFFNDCLPKFSKILCTVFYVGLYHAGFTIVLNALTFMYMVLHVIFQCFLLKKRFERFEYVSEKMFNSEDESYQLVVEKKLIYYIKHHQTLQNFVSEINDIMYYPILCFTSCGIVCTVALLIVPQILAESFWRVLTAALLTFCLIIIFCVLGQMLENMADEIYYVVSSLPWYLWSNKNKKLLLLLLANCQQNMILSSSGLITVNYQLLISLYQKIYSTITFLVNMTYHT